MALVLVPTAPSAGAGGRDAAGGGAAAGADAVGRRAGPAGPDWLTPEASAALAAADVLVGYGPYLDRVPRRAGQRRHASDNRVELDRARHALELAAAGSSVAVVSSGDPGIFAMATAVLEAVESGNGEFANVDLRVVPGLSAMHAAAARVGAPLGHDFAVISLSDQRKPWRSSSAGWRPRARPTSRWRSTTPRRAPAASSSSARARCCCATARRTARSSWRATSAARPSRSPSRRSADSTPSRSTCAPCS